MTPENKQRYLELGGLVYRDLERLSFRQNDDQGLLDKLSHYFQTALLVEILDLQMKKNVSLIKINLTKTWGVPQSLLTNGQTLTISNDDAQFLKKKGWRSFYLLESDNAIIRFVIYDKKIEAKVLSAFEGNLNSSQR
jgi:hypothetical protein